MAKAKLEQKHKIFIVTELAAWESPTLIRDRLKELFDIEVSLPAILNYDPATGNGSKKWKDLFDEQRKKFLDNADAIPIANKAFRLRELDRLYKNQKTQPGPRQNPVEMRATLEQAAKESGDGFSNTRKLVGKDGGALIPETPPAQVVLYLPDNGRGDGPRPVTSDSASPAIDKKK